MIERTPWSSLLDRELRRQPVVCLYGSRQVGKTTLAKQIAARSSPTGLYVDLERPSDRQLLAEPEIFLRGHAGRLVVLDEIQRAPELFTVLRALVDEDRHPGRFLVLGSAAPALLGQASESLAGRIAYVELPPLWIGEAASSNATADALWLRGGYPPSFSAASDADSFAWRTDFLRSYLERDLGQLGVRVPAATMERFLRMLAHVHGQVWNAASLARSLGVTGPTVAKYLDGLVDACLVRRLPAFETNLKKRLVKSPRVYLRDSGLLHALHDVTCRDRLLGHVIVGASFEGFAIEQILASLHERHQRAAGHFRTHAGAEIDLVLSLPRGNRTRRVGVEIKHSAAPTLSRGVHEAMADLELEELFVVVPRTRADLPSYRLGERVTVVALREFVTGNWLP
jgi:predicted AAA+ superfamily ATPase